MKAASGCSATTWLLRGIEFEILMGFCEQRVAKINRLFEEWVATMAARDLPTRRSKVWDCSLLG